MSSVDSKRQKLDQDDDDDKFLSSLTLTLHPAGLGKGRRGIFEKQIAQKGGKLIPFNENCDCLVLIEDTLMAEDKVNALVAKLEGNCTRGA